MRFTIWAGAILAIMLFAVLSIAKSTGHITGRVIDSQTQRPVAGATIVVEGTGLTTRTGPDGMYTIVNVPAGVYIVRVEKAGASTTLHRVSVTAGQTVTADFTMSRLQEHPVEGEKARHDELGASRDSKTSPIPGLPMSPSPTGAAQGRMVCELPATAWCRPDFESYDLITENGWLSTLDKPLSTFSVDVDAASYGNMRRFITSGQLPPVDAVRIEELINYFDYDYPDPRGQHPFSITTEVAECPWNRETQARAHRSPGQAPRRRGAAAEQPRLPDRRVRLDEPARQAAAAQVVVPDARRAAARRGPGGDRRVRGRRRTRAAFDARERQGRDPLRHRPAAGRRVDRGRSRHSARLPGRARRASSRTATTASFSPPTAISTSACRATATWCVSIEEKRRSGVFLTVLGFGEGNLKDSKMEKIADQGNGHYAYIDNIIEAQKVLVNEMGATLLTIAKDVKLQVEFNPARVASYRLVGYENRLLQDRDFDDDTKDAGEIGAGHSVTALYEITLAGREDDRAARPLKYSDFTVRDGARRSNELLTVSFRYKRPTESESRLLSLVVTDRHTRFARPRTTSVSPPRSRSSGMILRDSPEKGDATLAQVIATARKARGEDPHGYRAEFVSLVETAEALTTPTVGAR